LGFFYSFKKGLAFEKESTNLALNLFKI